MGIFGYSYKYSCMDPPNRVDCECEGSCLMRLFLQAATYLCPAIFPWVDSGPATEESGMFVMKMVGVLYPLIVIFDLIVVCGMGTMGSATTFFLCLFFFAIVAVLLIISRKPQNR